MDKTKISFNTIDEYISQFAPDVREKLESIRSIIKEEAPDAKEIIRYQMPTFTLFGNLVHFAAFKNHIRFYPTPSGIEAFKGDISKYKNAKGSIQFPIDEPLPFDLIKAMVKFRVIENTMLAQAQNKKKKEKL